MGDKTAISWADKTWNPWQGCTKVSPGCAHCYMYREKTRYGQEPATVVRSMPATFNAPLQWTEPGRVFTCSWSDFFHEDADEWRAEAWDIIRRTPQLTYMILTKRPERIAECLPAGWGAGWPHVWLGTSVENQHWADIRIPLLLGIPATVRFLSCEPLLGPVDLRNWLVPRGHVIGLVSAWGDQSFNTKPPLNWVIAGGESGPGARPMHPDWVRSLRDQCQAAGVSFHFKQWGEWMPVQPVRGVWYDFLDVTGKMGQCKLNADGTWHQDPRGPSPAILAFVGKKQAGRLLDEREWNEFPEVTSGN